jgi:hypothetical protein
LLGNAPIAGAAWLVSPDGISRSDGNARRQRRLAASITRLRAHATMTLLCSAADRDERRKQSADESLANENIASKNLANALGEGMARVPHGAAAQYLGNSQRQMTTQREAPCGC